MSRHTRSHPPTLLTVARRTLEDECDVARGSHLVVAVSGGRDSMALLHVLAKLRKPLGFTLAAHGIDHGLRESAARELDLAERFASDLDVPFERTQVKIDRRGGNLQERARVARYSVLERLVSSPGAGASASAEAAGSTPFLATAHHADDRAETVLLRMMRGASASGLAVLPPRLGFKIRPFVRATRAAVDLHVARHHIPYSDDPSNADPRFLRTRVRSEVLPLLRELSPGIVAHLCGIADDVAASADPEHSRANALPRATREALRTLETRKNARGRVALPGGRLARYDRASDALVIEIATPRLRPPTSS